MKSAGIAHSIVQSCSLGLLEGCGCDDSGLVGTQSSFQEGWKWGGCSANVEYGVNFAQIFVDAADKRGTPRSLMNLHNSRAGRKVRKAGIFHVMMS